MAWQWVRRSRGEAAYQALLDSAVAAPAPKAIVPADPADFATLFGAATFQRGPAVLALLERQMGTAAFRRALRAYVARHAGGTVTTADFQRATEQAYGKPLDAFFARCESAATAPGAASDHAAGEWRTPRAKPRHEPRPSRGHLLARMLRRTTRLVTLAPGRPVVPAAGARA